MTKEIKIKNVVKQETVYGTIIGCKPMERVNNIGERAVTIVSPRVGIEALTYVDDIAGIGDRVIMEKVIRNCRMIEERKKMTVNMDESNYLVIRGKRREKQKSYYYYYYLLYTQNNK